MTNEFSSLWSPGIDLEYVKIKKLPPGYRFKPTDYELLEYYLRWKKQGHPNANIIKEIPQDKCNPDELEREFSNRNEDEWYFFTEAKPLRRNRVVRRAGNGTWKSGTGATAITDGSKTVGYKTTLTFAYIQKGNKAKKTIWNMHEYRLAHQSGKRKGDFQQKNLSGKYTTLERYYFHESKTLTDDFQILENQNDNLVLCKIYKRRVSRKTYEALDEENTSISCIANNETDVSYGSCNSWQSPTIVSNGSEHMLSDVSSTECVEINHQFRELPIEDVNCLKWLEEFLRNEEVGNDPRMFPAEELNRLEEEFMRTI